MVGKPWRTALVLFVLFLAVWIPRVLALNRFVTEDERRWLTRSANFYQAITHGDWAHTFQREHPGVTVMWMGTLGFVRQFPRYAQLAPGQFGWDQEELESWLYQNSAFTPLELLAAGRWWIVLAIALAITACYFPLRKLFGVPVAAVTTLYIGWSPFYLALSRQLHPDGLVASLILLALVNFLAWLYADRSWRFLLISGIVMGLAWLTKTPAIFLVPTGAVLLLYECWRPLARSDKVTGSSGVGSFSPLATRPSSPCHLVTLSFVLWGLFATLTFILLWPALWVDPLGTFLRMGAEMGEYVEGHVNPNYFLGQITADPGPFFYPVAYLFRTTPATLIGLVLVTVAAWRHTWPLDRPSTRRTALGLLLFTLILVAGMTLGAKKFDRYLLPVFPVLDILAVFGWLAFGWEIKRLRDWRLVMGRIQSPISQSLNLPISLSPGCLLGLLVTFLLHALPGFLHYPYYLTYYNPLAGGSTTALHMLMVGWGEGLDAAADWLNQQPNAEKQRVVSWYGTGPLSYFLRSREPVSSFWSPDFWFDADYAVVYVNQQQRRIPAPEVMDFFANRSPVHAVTFGGLELARIYDMQGVSPPDFTGIFTESAADFAGQLRLAAYAVGQHAFLSGDEFTIRLYLKRLDSASGDYTASVRLLAPDNTEVGRSEHLLPNNWSLHQILADEHEIQVPAAMPSGEYNLVLTLHNIATGATLPDDGGHVITPIQLQAARHIETNASWGAVRLTRLQHEPTMQPGQTLYVDMTAEGQVDGSLKLSARLIDSAGTTLAQTDKVLTANPRFDLSLPADAPPGAYTLVAVVYDPTTLNPLADQDGNLMTTLSKIEVVRDE